MLRTIAEELRCASAAIRDESLQLRAAAEETRIVSEMVMDACVKTRLRLVKG